jgi:flagellar basal-body rod modification protein FlgD
MLIAQLENQDPLDPQDATEFTAQLAQFSSLDQLMSMRRSIETLASAGGISDGLAAAGLIGHGALVESRELDVASGEAPPPTLALDLSGAAEVLSVEVLDAAGLPVSVAPEIGSLPVGRHELDWESFGGPPPPGRYRLRVTVAQGDPTPTLLVRSQVTGAALDPSGAVLLLGSLEVPLTSLREIGDGPIRADR